MIGDIHGAWTDADARWFEGQDYDCVIVVGDLAGWRWGATLQLAQALGRMKCRGLVFPGNHDATHAVSLVNEAVGGFSRVRKAFMATQLGRRMELALAVQPHPLAGYSTHPLGDITLVCGRPHSMGGPDLSFKETIEAAYGIKSMEQSAAKICELVDQAPTKRIVFVAHNGPTGMGATRDAIWGCDFKPGAGDWGDPDLRTAIDHARKRDKTVLAVVAGHMHRRLRGGGERPGFAEEQGTVLVNAAVVPRIVGKRHHHVELTIDGDRVTAVDRYVELK